MENIVRMMPGPKQYVISHGDDVKSVFSLFFTRVHGEVILDVANLEGKSVFGDTRRALDKVDDQAYMGLLILLGAH